MPSHAHTISNFRVKAAINAGGDDVFAFGTGVSGTGVLGADIVSSSQGSGTPHENRPPYYVLAYIIKL
jgi:microcystin-dependent protein